MSELQVRERDHIRRLFVQLLGFLLRDKHLLDLQRLPLHLDRDNLVQHTRPVELEEGHDPRLHLAADPQASLKRHRQ